jgi:hypothetical protein
MAKLKLSHLVWGLLGLGIAGAVLLVLVWVIVGKFVGPGYVKRTEAWLEKTEQRIEELHQTKAKVDDGAWKEYLTAQAEFSELAEAEKRSSLHEMWCGFAHLFGDKEAEERQKRIDAVVSVLGEREQEAVDVRLEAMGRMMGENGETEGGEGE